MSGNKDPISGSGFANADPSFWDFALKYYDKEPLIANIAVLIVAATPIIIAGMRFIHKQKQSQIEKHKNILHYQVLLEKVRKGHQK